MRKDNSFDALLDSIAAIGEEERETIEEAKAISSVIEALVSARIDAGMTQRQLAEKCGMNQATLARIEALRVSPRLDTLVHIARVLGQEISVSSVTESSMPTNITIFPTAYAFGGSYDWKAVDFCDAEVNIRANVG